MEITIEMFAEWQMDEDIATLKRYKADKDEFPTEEDMGSYLDEARAYFSESCETGFPLHIIERANREGVTIPPYLK